MDSEMATSSEPQPSSDRRLKEEKVALCRIAGSTKPSSFAVERPELVLSEGGAGLGGLSCWLEVERRGKGPVGESGDTGSGVLGTSRRSRFVSELSIVRLG